MNLIANENLNNEIKNLERLRNNIINSTSEQYLPDFLLTLANIKGKKFSDQEIDEIKNFYKKFNFLAQIFLYKFALSAKENNYLGMLETVLKVEYKGDSFVQKLMYSYELAKPIHNYMLENNLTFDFIHGFNIFFTNFKDFIFTTTKNIVNNAVPTAWINMLKAIPLEDFIYYKKFLEQMYISSKHFQNSTKLSSLFRSVGLQPPQCFKKDYSYLFLIDTQIKHLKAILRNKLDEEQKPKNIDRIINNKKNHLISPADIEKECTTESLKTIGLSKIIAQNGRLISNKEQELQKLKEEFPDDFENLFLDFNYNITFFDEPSKKVLKSAHTIDEYRRILKALQNKAYNFFNTNHPKFVSILSATSDHILKEIAKDILNKKLTSEFLIKFPEIMMENIFENYQRNKQIIEERNLQIAFFFNSSTLLLPQNQFIAIIDLIQTYQCIQLPLYDLTYFDQIDEVIETRFPVDCKYKQMMQYGVSEVTTQLNKNIPIDIFEAEKEPEIIRLDQNFLIDPLRYKIAGHIISRIKVLRYFKALNQVNPHRSENLKNAILYNTYFFEFEQTEIIECLENHPTRVKDYSPKE